MSNLRGVASMIRRLTRTRIIVTAGAIGFLRRTGGSAQRVMSATAAARRLSRTAVPDNGLAEQLGKVAPTPGALMATLAQPLIAAIKANENIPAPSLPDLPTPGEFPLDRLIEPWVEEVRRRSPELSSTVGYHIAPYGNVLGLHVDPDSPSDSNRTIDFEGERYRTFRSGLRIEDAFRLLHGSIRAFAEDYAEEVKERYEEHLNALLPSGETVLYSGSRLRVLLLATDDLVLSRRLTPFTLASVETRKHYPAVELRLRITLGEQGTPTPVGRVLVSPSHRHPFVSGDRICVAGWVPRTNSWVDASLAMINAAEIVYKIPLNPSGAGGHNQLANC